MSMTNMKCHYCGRDATLERSKGNYKWVCHPCDASVGCHKGTAIALGSLAKKELRTMRVMAHKALDPLWESVRDVSHYIRKSRAYAWISKELGIPRFHIGQASIESCKRVIELCKEKREDAIRYIRTGADQDAPDVRPDGD